MDSLDPHSPQPSHSAQASSSSASTASSQHPFENAKGLLVVIQDSIDVEEEARLYEELCETPTDTNYTPPDSPPLSPKHEPSVYSRDIWLGDNCGASRAFARSVEVGGWTSVGDKLGGAYIVYDCVIRTKEGTAIHAHKRYSSFVQLYDTLRASLPESQRHFVPQLPPKFPLAKYRPSFLDHRRRLLQHWLSAVLLHPDIGGCQAVREWVMD
ncbi:Phox-like protein [Obba rivulosa]|uniref:Endosomal/vacuolar adapter protein YPT35 n=1 Tax=Obba rivulosa TaxID=1052685 RepID=A0A8E2AII8_9APHY|nr:Phox-like protein [Obba rivulosa]